MKNKQKNDWEILLVRGIEKEVIHYQRNTNQNHNEVPSQAGPNGCYQ